MKSLLEKELRLLAQEILEIKSSEDLSLCHEKARLLYEKLTVMVYTGHHLSCVDVDEKEDIDIAIASTDSSEDTAPLCLADDAEDVIEEETPSIPPVIEKEKTVAETVEDTPVIEDSPTTEEIKEDSNIDEETEPLKEEGTIIEEEIIYAEKKKQRKTAKIRDILQQSLFDQDLFSSQIIGFDPDEDLFEKAPTVEKTTIKEEEATEEVVEETIIEESIITEEPPVEIQEDVTEEPTPTINETEDKEEEEDSTARLIDEIIDSPIKTDAAPVNERKSFFSFRIMEDDSNDEAEAKSTTNEKEEETPSQEEEPIEEKEEAAVEEIVETPQEQADEINVEETEDEAIIEEENTQEETINDVVDTAEDIEENEEEEIETPAQEEEEEPIKEKEEAAVEEIVETPQETTMTINEALAQNSSSSRKISVNEMLATKNIAISLNDRLAFINNLFDGEVEDFENTIRYIFSQKEVDVVIEYITEIIKPYYNNWIEKEEYEKRFMEIILKYFT